LETIQELVAEMKISKRYPSVPLKKREEDNLIDSPPFTRGAGGDL
jgi:hypothetical protein